MEDSTAQNASQKWGLTQEEYMDKIPHDRFSVTSGNKDKMLKLWVKNCTATSGNVFHSTLKK